MENNNVKLGDMPLSRNTWSKGFCFCKNEDNCCQICTNDIDPDEYIIVDSEIQLTYSYYLKYSTHIVHRTSNPEGFTRREISEQILSEYQKLFKDNKFNLCYNINDLFLCAIKTNNNKYFVEIYKGTL